MMRHPPLRPPIVTLCAAALCAAAWLSPSAALAGAWLQQPRHCYGKLWDRAMFGSKAYSAEGLRDLQDVPSYQDHLLNIYAECGVHPWVTALIAVAPAGYASAGDRDTFYIGPLSAGARIGLLREGQVRLAVSARYGYSPAVGDEVLSTSTFTTDDGRTVQAVYQPAVENHFGELQVELGLGFSLGRAPAFFTASLGSRLNSAAGVDHLLLAATQIGATFFEQLVIDLHFGLHEPFFQAVELTNTSGAGQTRFLGFGMTFSWWFIDALAVFFNFDGVLYAKSNAATPAFTLGLETRLAL